MESALHTAFGLELFQWALANYRSYDTERGFREMLAGEADRLRIVYRRGWGHGRDYFYIELGNIEVTRTIQQVGKRFSHHYPQQEPSEG